MSQQRRQTALTLSREVTSRMQQLGMEGGVIRHRNQRRRPGIPHVVMAWTELNTWSQLTPVRHLNPLIKVASGGELSRIALALQVCVMEASSTPTLIFDEIDVGIGGRVAEIVGQQLARLGSVTASTLHHPPGAGCRQCPSSNTQINKSGDPVEASIHALRRESKSGRNCAHDGWHRNY